MYWYSTSASGLSPRVRGNLRWPRFTAAWGRSIPTCAGEPASTPTAGGASGVYPRVCGGTAWASLSHRNWTGLSPRVRGNHLRRPAAAPGHRSIPACAGEPRRMTGCGLPAWVYPRVCGEPTGGCRPPSGTTVYPRVCGGTDRSSRRTSSQAGLSPRVRGNPHCHHRCKRFVRSIPACAGEPAASLMAAAPASVYPRVCGGT